MKVVDKATYDAIARFTANGGVVRKAKPDTTKIARDTWRGGKVTVGFRLNDLNDEVFNG